MTAASQPPPLPKQGKPLPVGRILCLVWYLAAGGALCAVVFFAIKIPLWFANQRFDEDRMIQEFRNHRPEFESLVTMAREDGDVRITNDEAEKYVPDALHS